MNLGIGFLLKKELMKTMNVNVNKLQTVSSCIFFDLTKKYLTPYHHFPQLSQCASLRSELVF